MKKITLLITDDHTLVRESWVMLFSADPRFEVVAQCGSGEEAIVLAARLRPAVVIMDINLPGVNGFEASEEILKQSPLSRILAVSLHTQPAYAKKILNLGAMGYVTKNSSTDEMIMAVLEVHNNRKYICEEIKNTIAEQEFGFQERNEVLLNLSKREIEIIRGVKNGLSSKEIAVKTGLNQKTVEVHRYTILTKLKLPNTAALVNFINHSELAPEL